jgi:hypothetical protein
MTITSISSATYVADLVNFIRDKLSSNITDPLSGKRVSSEKFVMTEYPRREVKFPIITVVDRPSRQEQRLGMQSEGTILRLTIEIRAWARNVKERDELYDSIHNYLRTEQFDTLTGANLHDFALGSVVNISEPDVKSKVAEFTWLYVCE